MAHTNDDEIIDWLVRVLRKAHCGTYVQMFPHHLGAAELFKDFPELREGGRRYYESVARRLIAEGVGPAAAGTARLARREK